MPEKILILSNSSSGLYDFRKELISELLKENEVISSVPAAEKAEDIVELGSELVDTEIDRRGVNPITDLGLLIRYFKLMKKLKPDLVITYTIKPNVYGGMLSRLLRIPYAANITGLGTAFQKKGALRRLISGMYKTALKKAKVVFFENPGNMQTLVKEKIVSKEQCCVLNGAGVNLEHFAFSTYPKEESETNFLFVGRVMQEKGVEELFYAMQKLNAEGKQCKLDILGYYEENYGERIKQYTDEGWLRFHGYQLDVRPFIEKSHCFVLPSYHEGMANTLLECGAMGRPLITSNIHGCLEAVCDGESGYICQVKSGEATYEAMKKFTELPYEAKCEMGKKSHDYVSGRFDKKLVVEETIKRLL